MTRNLFEAATTTDLFARQTYLAHQLTATLLIDGPVDDVIAFAAVLNGGGQATASNAASDSVLGYLAAERAKSTSGTPPRSQRLFHIPLPHVDSLVEIAAEFALELVRDWPSISAVMVGTPHRNYPSQQVLVVCDGTHSYAEQGADSTDAVVLVTSADGPLGILSDGRWAEAEDCEYCDAAEFLDAHLDNAGGAAYLALLGAGRLPEDWFTSIELSLASWGTRLWAVTTNW